MTPNVKGWLIAGITFAVLMFGSLALYSSKQAKLAAVWEGIAQANKAQAEKDKAHATEAETARDEARGAADSIATENARLSARLADALSKIPKPKPVPVSDPEFAGALETAGLAPGLKVLHQPEPSTLNRPDAEKLWAWNQDAAMVPSLKASLAMSQDVSAGLSHEITALRLSNAYAVEAGDAWHAAHDRQQDRADALGKSVQALTKKQKADWWVKWGTVAGGVAAGYLAGRIVR